MSTINSFNVNTNHHTKNHLKMTADIGGGSIVALVTPMTSNNQIDYNKLKDLTMNCKRY
jgi:hypothetical protein